MRGQKRRDLPKVEMGETLWKLKASPPSQRWRHL